MSIWNRSNGWLIINSRFWASAWSCRCWKTCLRVLGASNSTESLLFCACWTMLVILVAASCPFSRMGFISLFSWEGLCYNIVVTILDILSTEMSKFFRCAWVSLVMSLMELIFLRFSPTCSLVWSPRCWRVPLRFQLLRIRLQRFLQSVFLPDVGLLEASQWWRIYYWQSWRSVFGLIWPRLRWCWIRGFESWAGPFDIVLVRLTSGQVSWWFPPVELE